MRNYIVASWNDADQYDYSGEQVGNRLSKSQKVHFNPDGSACVASYADNESTKSATSIPLRDRILPQAKRVNTLTDQLIELEQEYKSGKMSIQEYTTYRAVLVTKRNRAEVLLNKAVSVKEPVYDVDDTEESYKSSKNPIAYGQNTGKNDEERKDIPIWLLDLNEANWVRNVGIKALHTGRTLVRWYQRTAAYVQTLKEV